ncbi:MAG: hypothetical protein HOV79_17180 [Hamadaea sp.]|nr:hypothetical protein [Hamadaea sp.]
MKIAVLHARQPLTSPVAEAFPDADVFILTCGPTPAVRDDVAEPPPRIVTSPIEDWTDVLAAERPDEIVSNDEYCLDLCARLRARFGMRSRHPAYPENYRDKTTMKRELAAAGIRVPRWHVCEPVTAADAAAVLERVGLPAVVKPRAEANSRGVRVLPTEAELRAWLSTHDGERGWQIEEHVSGEGHHVNAVVRDGRVEPVQVGRYFGPLLDLPAGRRLGGVTVSDAGLHAVNERVVAALGGDGAFVVHTELIVTPAGEPVVIEVAARAPGGDVPRMALRHTGLHLEHAHLRLQAGLPVGPAVRTGDQAAWLWVPVMPGERFASAPPLRSAHELVVRPAGRSGHDGPAGVLGMSLVLWNADAAQFDADLATALAAPWFL